MSTSEALLSTLAERPIDLAVMDVSFISQTLILPEIAPYCRLAGSCFRW